VTAFALIALGGLLMLGALGLRGAPVPRLLPLATGLCGLVATTAGALRL
jgi:hypothetical protein